MLKLKLSLIVFSLACLASIEVRAQQAEIISEDGTAIRKSIGLRGEPVIEYFQAGNEDFMPSPQDFRRIEMQELTKLRERSRRNISIKLSDAVSMVESMLSRQELLLKHGFLPEQLLNLESALETYDSNISFVCEKMSDMDSIKVAKVEILVRFFREINSILEPQQVEKFKRWGDTEFGLAKVLLRTEIGDEIELTDGQRNRMEAACQRISDEIIEFAAKKRQEALAATKMALSKDQRTKLGDLISLDEFERSLNLTPLSTLRKQLDFWRNE